MPGENYWTRQTPAPSPSGLGQDAMWPHVTQVKTRKVAPVTPQKTLGCVIGCPSSHLEPQPPWEAEAWGKLWGEDTATLAPKSKQREQLRILPGARK